MDFTSRELERLVDTLLVVPSDLLVPWPWPRLNFLSTAAILQSSKIYRHKLLKHGSITETKNIEHTFVWQLSSERSKQPCGRT